MAISRSLSIQLDEQLYQRLIEAAGSRRLDTSEAAAQAIEAWVDIDAWHRAEIEAGLAEAERGDFASDAEVAAVFDRWASSRSE
jgi:predicted transcriptional regulator